MLQYPLLIIYSKASDYLNNKEEIDLHSYLVTSDGVPASKFETETKTEAWPSETKTETETRPSETKTTPSETETLQIRDQDWDRDLIFNESPVRLNTREPNQILKAVVTTDFWNIP